MIIEGKIEKGRMRIALTLGIKKKEVLSGWKSKMNPCIYNLNPTPRMQYLYKFSIPLSAYFNFSTGFLRFPQGPRPTPSRPSVPSSIFLMLLFGIPATINSSTDLFFSAFPTISLHSLGSIFILQAHLLGSLSPTSREP